MAFGLAALGLTGVDACRSCGERAKAERDRLQSENEKLCDALRALMMGTYAELCTERDASQCRECSMGGESDDSCLVADACEVLGIDMYGEQLGVEVD